MFCNKADATLGLGLGILIAWLAYPYVGQLVTFFLTALDKWHRTAACFGDLLNCVQS